MHGDRYFLDTNVLLYAYDKFDSVKRALAKRWLATLWGSTNCAISGQVLQEFYSTAVRKFSVAPPAARNLLTVVNPFETPPPHRLLLQ